MQKDSYEEDPVYYCKRCLSLSICSVPYIEGQDYCRECGATDIGITDIETWKTYYRERYGHDFIMKEEQGWPY
jgi:hypothetical protein